MFSIMNERLRIETGTQMSVPSNQLELSLRARLLRMAEIVAHQTSRVFESGVGVANRVEMNVTVLRGLKGAE